MHHNIHVPNASYQTVVASGDQRMLPTWKGIDVYRRKLHRFMTPTLPRNDFHELRRRRPSRRPNSDRYDNILALEDRKSTRLNSSHVAISYAVFCLKKKKKTKQPCNRVHTPP